MWNSTYNEEIGENKTYVISYNVGHFYSHHGRIKHSCRVGWGEGAKHKKKPSYSPRKVLLLKLKFTYFHLKNLELNFFFA